MKYYDEKGKEVQIPQQSSPVIPLSLSSIAPSSIAAAPAAGSAGTAVGSSMGGGELIADGLGGSAVAAESGIGLGPLAAIAAATYLGGKEAYDIYQGGRNSNLAGRATLGIATGGLSEVARPFFGKSRTKGEETARKALAEKGIVVPNSGVKEWENNEKFRQSRNEADLTGKDIRNAASLYGIAGYDKLDAAKQEAISQEALNRGLVREHHGQVDINVNPEFQKYLETTMAGNSKPQQGQRRDNRNERRSSPTPSRPRASLVDIMPAETTQAPRYDLNPSSLIRNPYL